jgi:hypothetical protein
MAFLTDLDVSAIRFTDAYKLINALEYEYCGIVFTAPKGFVTDFATIPRLLWCVVYPSQCHIRDAAVIHDLLYTTKVVDRSTADKILLAAMLELKSSKVLAYLTYGIVRVCGHWYYTR